MINIERFTDTNGWRWYIDRDTKDKYLSVTLILGLQVVDGLLNWFKNTGPAQIKKRSKETSEWGSVAHSLVENDLKGNKPEIPESHKLFYEQWNELKTKHDIRPMETEFMVAHSSGYAGQADIIALVDHIPTVLDLKTGNLSESAYLQMAAYVKAYGEMTGVTGLRTGVIHIHRDGKIPPKIYTRLAYEVEKDFDDFERAFRLFLRFYKTKLQGETNETKNQEIDNQKHRHEEGTGQESQCTQ